MKKKVLGIIAATTLLFSGCNQTKPVPGPQSTTVTPTTTSEIIPTSSSEEEQPTSSEIPTSSSETPTSSEPTTSDVPVTSEEPISSEEPGSSQEPGSSEEPSTPSEPTTPTSEEPVTPVDPEPSEPEETEHEITINPSDGTAVDGGSAGVEYSITKDAITLTATGTLTAEQIRIFKNKSITFTGAKITKIVFNCTASGTTKQGPGCFGSGAPEGYTYEGKVGTWEGEATELTFTCVDNQVRCTSIVITYLA